jgi:hypothetical protein
MQNADTCGLNLFTNSSLIHIERTCVNSLISVLFSENDAHNPYFDCKLCFSGSRLYIYFQAVFKGSIQPDWICMRLVPLDRP